MFLKLIFPSLFLTICTTALGQTLIEKADKQYELHAYRLAAKSYESVLTGNDDQWGATLRLADCYLHLNDLEKAASQYARAVADGQVQPEDMLRYGRVLMMLGQYENAEQRFKVYAKTNAAVANQFIKACEYARSNNETPSSYEVTSLSKINTNGAEFGLTMWKNQLIWSSTRTDFKRPINNQKNDIIDGEPNQLFIAPIEGLATQANKVHFLKTDLRNTFNESNPSFSPDGKTVAFMRNNIAEDERVMSNGGLEMSLYLADVDAAGNWLNVRPFAHNSGSTGFPSFSADGKTLYYASNRAGGQGGFDIYKSEKKGTIWGESQNLGTSINTKGDEITPFHDGKTLFFASDWHFGFGGYDIFKVAGAEVINLGTGVNSSGDDYGFIFDPSPIVSGSATVSSGFFVSNRKGVKGKDDIYSVKLTVKAPTTAATTATTTPSTTQPKPDKVPTSMSTTASNLPEYSAMVTDGSSGEPLEGVTVRLVNQKEDGQSQLTTDVKGKFRFHMAGNGVFLLIFSKEGFVEFQKVVKAADFKTRFLGEYPLKPSSLTNKDEIAGANPSANMPPKVVTTTVVTTTQGTKAPDIKKNVPTFYAVQFAVLKLTETVDANKYDGLKKEGNLYGVTENNTQKVRLGVYKTREEALAATKKVATMGYTDAFVVEEKNEQFSTENMFSAVPKPIKPNTPVTDEPKAPAVSQPVPPKSEPELPEPYTATAPPKVKPTPPKAKPAETVPPKVKPTTAVPPKEMPQPYSVALPSNNPPVAVEDKTYKVRIASMKKPEWFDDSKVSKLWKVEKIQEGDVTIFYMDGFKTLQDAKAMKQKVKETGYDDAKVVTKNAKGGFKVVD